MSNLLMDEYPLLVLPKLATKIGLNEAIVLQQIHYWIKGYEKERRKSAYHEGHYWVFNSYRQWQEDNFPFWHQDTVKRTIGNLEEKNLLVVGNFNKKKGDKTKWYRVNYEVLLEQKNSDKISDSEEELLGADCTEAQGKLHQPLPETTRDYKRKSSATGEDLLLKPAEQGATRFEEEYARIRSEPSIRGVENAAREALKNGADLPVVNSLLSKRIPKGYEKFSATPRFAMKLHAYEGSKAEDDFKLANLWKALAEDVGGVDFSEKSKTFSELRGTYKKILLSKYSYDQCIWTLRRAVTNTSNLSFLASGGRNLVTLVQQNSKEYHDLRTEAKRLESMEKAQAERRASVEENKTKEEAPPIEVSLKDNPLMLSLFQNAINKGKP